MKCVSALSCAKSVTRGKMKRVSALSRAKSVTRGKMKCVSALSHANEVSHARKNEVRVCSLSRARAKSVTRGKMKCVSALSRASKVSHARKNEVRLLPRAFYSRSRRAPATQATFNVSVCNCKYFLRTKNKRDYFLKQCVMFMKDIDDG